MRISGTSMSAPMVTGVVSLLLEADPSLSSAEVKDIITNTARTDNLTGDIGPEGHLRWGHGKLDALNALQSITNTATQDVTTSRGYLFPNPATDIVYVRKELTGNETYRLTGLDGRTISSGSFDGSLLLEHVASGMYFLNIENTTGTETYSVIVAK